MGDDDWAPSVGEKRKLDAFFPLAPPAKKLVLAQHTRETLSLLSPAELLDTAEALASRCRALESKPAPPPVPVVSKEALAAQKSKVCSIVVKQIQAQMKWKPSCKTGGGAWREELWGCLGLTRSRPARWTYEGLCSPEVYKLIMAPHLKPKELAGSLKAVTSKRLTPEEFLSAMETTYLSAPIRFGSLSLTGASVTVRYDASSGELRASGSYGL